MGYYNHTQCQVDVLQGVACYAITYSPVQQKQRYEVRTIIMRYNFTFYTEHTEKGNLISVMLVLHVILIRGFKYVCSWFGLRRDLLHTVIALSGDRQVGFQQLKTCKQ